VPVLENGLAPDLHAVLPDVRPTEVLEQCRAERRISRGTPLGRVLVPDNEKCHETPSLLPLGRARVIPEPRNDPIEITAMKPAAIACFIPAD
jgi:hypothetical protein